MKPIVKFGKGTSFKLRNLSQHNTKQLSGCYGQVTECRRNRRLATVGKKGFSEDIDVTTEWLIANAVIL